MSEQEEKLLKEENQEQKTEQKIEKKAEKKKSKMIKVDEAEYNALVQELKEVKDKHVRLYAEFDNARKRMEREKTEFVKYAASGLIVEFLDIYDDLERSVAAIKNEIKDENSSLVKGLEMVQKRTEEFLKKNGVKPIKALGQIFDHDCHEVMMQVETNEHEDNTVIEVFQQGYYLGEKVVRTAKVKLAKNNSVQPTDKSNGEVEANNI